MVDDLIAPQPPLRVIPHDLRSLADYERLAPRHMPAATWAHVQEGADTAQGSAKAAFDRWRLLPRALADLRGGSTQVDLPDGRHASPLMIAPIAYQRLAHSDGELAVVRGATALGIGMIVSTLASHTLEAIATAQADAARQLERVTPALWFQLYLQPRRDDTLRLVRRAEAVGYRAVVLTIDAGVKPSAFALPPGIEAVNLAGMDRPRHTASATGGLLFGSALVDALPRWDDLAWLRSATTLPIFVKGMITGDDVHRVTEAGIQGLILSDHGGRVLDSLPSPLDMVEDVCAAAHGRLTVLLDASVRRGTDVVKAICLGASAALVGRPIMHALAVAGTAGVAHALQLLRLDIELAMIQMGCPSVEALSDDWVVRA